MRKLVLGFFVAAVFGLASPTEGVELFNYSRRFSYMKMTEGSGLAWDPTFLKVESVEVSPEALKPNRVAISNQEISEQGIVIREKLTFQVDGISYTAALDHFEDRSRFVLVNGQWEWWEDYTWFGYVEGSQFLTHFAFFRGEVAGEIWMPIKDSNAARPYYHRSIFSRGGQEFLIMRDNIVDDEMEDGPFSAAENGKREIETSISGSFRGRLVARQPRCVPVDIAYLYDTTFLEWMSSSPDIAEREIYVISQTAVDAINAAIRNSKAGSNYRVRLAGVRMAHHTAPNDLYSSLFWMKNSEEVRDIRKTLRADVVGMWIQPGYVSLSGVAFTRSNDSINGDFFNVVVGGDILTAVHEFGHNTGMRHSPRPDQVLRTFAPFANGHYVDGLFRDAVSTTEFCPSRCNSVPVFSNPNVFVEGVPTGIQNERENWRMIAESFWVMEVQRLGSPCVE